VKRRRTHLSGRDLELFGRVDVLGELEVDIDVDAIEDGEGVRLLAVEEVRLKPDVVKPERDLGDDLLLRDLELVRETKLSEMSDDRVVLVSSFVREDEDGRLDEDIVVHLRNHRLHLRCSLRSGLSGGVVDGLHATKLGEEDEDAVNRFGTEGEAERTALKTDARLVTGVRRLVCRIVRLVLEVGQLVALDGEHLLRQVGAEVVVEGEVAETSGDTDCWRPKKDGDIGGGEGESCETKTALVKDEVDAGKLDLNAKLVDRAFLLNRLLVDGGVGRRRSGCILRIGEGRHDPVEEDKLPEKRSAEESGEGGRRQRTMLLRVTTTFNVDISTSTVLSKPS